MNSKMKSSVKSLLAGLVSRAEFPQGKEPVAYLYNGVRLPKLPEWDRVAYPYAYLNFQYFGTYLQNCFLYAFTEPKHKTVEYSNGYYATGVSAGEKYLSAQISNGVFTEPEEKTPEFDKVLASTIDWANYDILNNDGTLYLAASEPTPVYE